VEQGLSQIPKERLEPFKKKVMDYAQGLFTGNIK